MSPRLTIAAVLLIAGAPAPGAAVSIPYAPPIDFADPTGFSRVFPVDLDQDGDPDIVGCSLSGVGWRENIDGAWTELIGRRVFDGGNVFGCCAGDFDGDGDLDLAGTASVGGTHWFENSGAGTVWTSHPLALNLHDGTVAADLDGDADDELVGRLGADLVILDLLPGGAWSIEVVAGLLGVWPPGLDVEDLDGDGDLDLASAEDPLGGGRLGWHENQGGSWLYHLLEANAAVWHLDVADLDGDGDPDLVDASASGIRWWDNVSGDASLFAANVISASTWNWPDRVEPADLDGDGDLDLVYGDPAYGGGVEAVLFNTVGDASAWTEVPVPPDPTAAASPQTLAAADLDGDGDLDLVATWRWLENLTGDGATWAPRPYESASPGPMAADMDGDGDLDLVHGDWVGWRENRLGDASVWVQRALPFEGTGFATAVDFDADGDPDLVGRVDDEVILWENTSGFGSSWVEHVLVSAPNLNGVAPVDVDGDGDLDLGVTGDFGSALARWYENEPSGSWPWHPVAPLGAGGRWADVDGDGDVDLAGPATWLGTAAVWVENVGAGAAWQTHPIGPTGPIAHLDLADLTGDGCAELLVGGMGPSAELQVHTNPCGPGSWAVQVLKTADYLVTVGAADLDQDGDLDVLGGFRDSPSGSSWWENLGAGASWVEHALTARALNSRAAVADFDGDGLVDLAMSLWGAAEVHLNRVETVAELGGGSPYAGQEGGSVTLDGTGSILPPPFAPFTWDWDCDGDGTYEVLGGSPLQTCAYSDDGLYPVGLRITDSAGGTSTTVAPVAVANLPPTITSTPPPTATDSVPWQYAAQADDPGVVDPQLWSLGAGAPPTLGLSPEGVLNWTPSYGDEGLQGFLLVVEDGDGGSDSQWVEIDVTVPDGDGDDLPDSWELAYGLDPTDPTDAGSDSDGDGLDAAAELAGGTDPSVFDGPSSPRPLAPVDGAEVAEATPTLRWDPAVDPQGDPLAYEVEVHASAEPAEPLRSAAGLPGTEWTVAGDLPENADLFWRVRAADPWAAGAWSPPERFFVNALNEAPPAPALLHPAPGDRIAEPRPTLRWSARPDPDRDALRFEVELRRGEEPMSSPAPTRFDSWRTPQLDEDRAFAWRVRALDEHGLPGPFTPWADFFVDAEDDAPSTPTWLRPADGAEVTAAPALIAGPATDPEGLDVTWVFRLELLPDRDPAERIVLSADRPTVSLAAHGVSLPEGRWIEGRVRAQDPRGTASPWSEPARFLVLRPGPTPAPDPLRAPEPGCGCTSSDARTAPSLALLLPLLVFLRRRDRAEG